MKKYLGGLVIMAGLVLAGLLNSDMLSAQVPAGLARFGTTGVFNPQAGNCVSILAMNSSGQVLTDSQVPCSPSYLATAYTNATTAYTAVMSLPPVQGNTVVRGECTITYSDNNTAGTTTFALGNSSTPVDLWATANITIGTYSAPVFTAITSTTTTAVTGALATATANAAYQVYVTFTLVNGTAPDTVTLYAESNSASYTVTVQPGSSCSYIP